MKRLIAQLVKFGLVGGMAFLIDYGLLLFLREICHLPVLVSATISYTVALIFNYLASMRYVFHGKEGASKIREFIIFAILALIGLGLNDLIMWIGVRLTFDYRIVKFAASAIVMIYNFVTRKLILEEHQALAVVSDDSSDSAGEPPDSSGTSQSGKQTKNGNM